MEHLIVQSFKPMLTFSSRADSVAYLFKHPVLMSPYYTELLERWASGLPPVQRGTALRAIALKKEVWDQIGKRQMKGPDIANPILALAESVAKGLITEKYACDVAGRPEFFAELMFPMVNATCEVAEQVVFKNWRPAVTMMKIALAAVEARRSHIPENQQPMDLITVESWLAIVTRAVSDVPDGRLFYDAVKRGDMFADIIDPNQDPPGQLLHRLGVLHLDPYVAGRSTQGLPQQLRAWQTRLQEEYGDSLAGFPPEQLNMPRIEVALPKAVDYFRRAAALRKGEARGRTLKAMAQALVWQDLMDLPVDASAIVAAAQEALTLLPAEQFPGEAPELTGMVKRFSAQAQAAAAASGSGTTSTHPVDAKPPCSEDAGAVAQARDVLATPVEQWVERIGRIRTEDLFEQSSSAVRDLDPVLAVRLWTAIDALMREEPEPRRRSYDRGALGLAKNAFAPDAPSADGTPVDKLLASLLQTARQNSWDAQRLAYSLLWLALSTTKTDQEEEGLGALTAAAKLAADGSDALLQRLVLWARAEMTLNIGVNAYNSNDFAKAARFYSNALRFHVEVQQPRAALDLLRRLLDLAKADRPEAEDVSTYLLASLAANALTLELAEGNAATYLIQFACRHLLALLSATGKLNLTVMLIMLDVAKGRRFRAARTENALPWLQHPLTIETEKQMAQLRAQAALEAPANPTAIDEQTLLTAYVSESEMRGGANATEKLRNLQIRFDTALDLNLSGGEEKATWIPEIESVQKLLDDHTVLLLHYIGMAPSGLTALTTLLVTREDAAAGIGMLEFPSSSVEFSDREEIVRLNPLSLSVSELRGTVRTPPGPPVVDSRAAATLAKDLDSFLGGGLSNKLAEFRAAGKDHLSICTHGPLHYYPFHLMGPEDQPLAADWRVTYLPNLHLLTHDVQAAAATGEEKAELAAIGINFHKDDPRRLPPLHQAEPEAQAIADIYKTRAIIGTAATESAVKYALTHSRRVHISTHGRHNVSAPAFQCVYVQPDKDNDGVIYAYELLRLDLHGLDLVTLSACETALGRFDVADNLRGIPATLLIAGVRTIVATLWPVESNTAARFFELFYTVLKNTESKLDAFCQAQAQTRREFPKYRDWGAFQMIGSWH